MDKQAKALDQWFERIRSSDVAARRQAASDLGMVLEKHTTGPLPGMPPDYEGWIPDELRLRRPTRREIARIIRVLHETILKLSPAGPQTILGHGDPHSKSALFFALSKGPPELVGPVILDVVIRRGVQLNEAETYQAMIVLGDSAWTSPQLAEAWASMGRYLRELDPRPWLRRAVAAAWSDENVREVAEHVLKHVERGLRASRPSGLARLAAHKRSNE